MYYVVVVSFEELGTLTLLHAETEQRLCDQWQVFELLAGLYQSLRPFVAFPCDTEKAAEALQGRQKHRKLKTNQNQLKPTQATVHRSISTTHQLPFRVFDGIEA